MYLRRVETMMRKVCIDGSIEDSNNITAIKLSKWLISHKGAYCAATYRQYRAALMMWIQECNQSDCDVAMNILNSVSHTPHMQRNLSNKTSSMKDKKFCDADRQAILNWLSNHQSRYSLVLSVLIQIGGSVGLRPCEWKSARVVKSEYGEHELHIVNAKASNGRANGDIRILIMNDLSLMMIKVIEQVAINFHKLDELGEWEKLYNGCRKTLYRACRDLWPNRKKYPTLYSLRHQFAADAKSSGMTKIEVAALLGHASLDTAGQHYGKRRVGRGQCAVKPSDGDVARLQINTDLVQLSTNLGI